MTFARPNILRKIPESPPPLTSDYRLLLAGKLRAAWDVRYGGEFAAGVWISHADVVSGIRVAAPSVGERPLAVADGTRFRGRPVIGTTAASGRRMLTRAMPDIVPVGTKPEIFVVARLPNGASQSGNLCGCADATASVTSGASFWTNSTDIVSIAGGQALLPFASTSVHLFSAFADDTAHHMLIDNGQAAEQASGLQPVSTGVVQAAVGGFATGFTTSIDAFVALWGIVCPAMTTAERARLLEIVRNDWWF